MKVRSAARAKSAGERAVERGRCGLHLIAISVRGALRVFYEIKLTSLHTHLAAPLTAERRPLAALESEFSQVFARQPHVHYGARSRRTDVRRQAARASAGARLPKWRQSGELEAAYSTGQTGHRAVYLSAADLG